MATNTLTTPCHKMPAHLAQRDLAALAATREQQQAADQKLLLEWEALAVRAAATAGHAVAVDLRQHPRHLGHAHTHSWREREREGENSKRLHWKSSFLP